MTLSDFLELLDWPEDALDDADSTTVGGWTLERFGTFPKPGDSFRYENLTVTVLAMDGRRVERVLVRPDPPEDRDE
jgi:putative hemolysin